MISYKTKNKNQNFAIFSIILIFIFINLIVYINTSLIMSVFDFITLVNKNNVLSD